MLSKKIFTFILAISICASVTACNSNSKQASPSKATNTQIHNDKNTSEESTIHEKKEISKETLMVNDLASNNSISNLNNSGIASIQGDWIYYISKKDINYSLYKKRVDNSEETKICDDDSLSINVIGDYIYYISDSNIYRIKTDGSDRKQLSDQKATKIHVVDGFIYYQNINDMKLYRLNIITNETFKLCDDTAEADKFFVKDDWIYYTSNGLYKINVDGSGKSKISDNTCHFPTIIDNLVYYLADDKIYKMNLDGSSREEIFSSEALSWVNITKKHIYFTDINNGGIYRINLDGSAMKKISDDFAYKINIIGNWLYYDYAKRPMDFKWLKLN
ncbi:DUF5050 domain-containing protein [Oceanirhabdus sp. W0125-5]|uniref:DUF5050 domain-containing protein n=1 Tax=Oceanirhabdus sp. W0125-5 TaxID=2999116 RepID=UPI0022F33B3E|nr:DUF5050 domain-containing protein [Oceanirhabdus sp. W0125-5]WBW98083.1 DUF5050 domain-containing protein [Oceanirhabdus sp. W0125-5]